MSNRLSTVARVGLLLACAAALAAAACSHNEQTSCSTGAAEVGAIEVDSATATATVMLVDQSLRKLTLRWDDGVVSTYTAGPDVVNFNKLKVGDKVKASVVEAVAVFVGPYGASPSVGAGESVSLAPKGAKPGMVLTHTVVLNDRLTSVDRANRTVMLQGVSGVPRKIKVAPGVDMSGLQPDDNVVLRVTDALAMSVEAP